MVTRGGRSRMERNGTGPDRHALPLSLAPSLPLLYGHTGWPQWDGTEQEGTGPTQAAAAIGSTRATPATRKAMGAYACYYVLFLFLYFHLFFISLFFFSDYFFSDKYNNSRRGTKGKRRTDGTGCTRAAIATWDGMEGADGANKYVFFYVLSFPLSSFILVILLLFQ